jgi:mannose-6-phosphate isomerase-like protein (cupin superfamily)
MTESVLASPRKKQMPNPDQPKPYQEIPPEFDGNNTEGYMQGNLDDIENISDWTSPESLKNKIVREFGGFKIYNAIDGSLVPDREVSLVIANPGTYPQHIHRDSDAFFIVVNGKALFISGNKEFEAGAGTKIKISKGTPHGFNINDGEKLEFVSIQNPPIKNHKTGEEDFHLYELV